MGKVPYFQIKLQNQLILRSYDDARRIIASGGSQAGRMFETAGLANVLRDVQTISQRTLGLAEISKYLRMLQEHQVWKEHFSC